jgi:hypothetical protein
MLPARFVVVASTSLAILISSCGGPSTPSAEIRANFERLLNALRDRDALTVCELLFPFGEHQPAGALAADLKRLGTPNGRSAYEKSVNQCVPSFAANPKNFTRYERGLAGAKLGTVLVHGDLARVQVVTRDGKRVTARFVKAAGEWRVLLGVQ